MSSKTERHDIALDEKKQASSHQKNRALKPGSIDQHQPDSGTEQGKFPIDQRRPSHPSERS